MPLDIEASKEAPSIRAIFSKTIELISAAHLLADNRHHQYAEEWAGDVYGKLSGRSRKTLKLLSGMRLQGMELQEFVLRETIFDDVELLLGRIMNYDRLNFIYTFTGEEWSLERIKAVCEGKEKPEDLIEELPGIANGKLQGMAYLFHNTEGFKRDMVDLLREINNEDLDRVIEAQRDFYRLSIQEVGGLLKEKHPIDVAQDITGRKFKRVYDFKDYVFVPSYFIRPHSIRFFNYYTQIIIFNLNRGDLSAVEMGDKLSGVLKVVSDRTRLEILRSLISDYTYGKALAEKLNLTTSTISHHLEQLKEINLVSEERIKNIKYFNANIDEIEKLFEEFRNYLFNK